MADKRAYRNIQFKKRTKRQQLITPAASLSSLLSGSNASINVAGASINANDPARMSKKNKMGKKVDKDKPLKERWLLTRKTWKYMADAGRRLIPDYIQNRGNQTDAQDLKKIEEYFQHVCRSEPKFLQWRRKQSFPGALGASFRRKHRWFGRNSTRLAPISDNKSSGESNVSSPRKFNSGDESEDDGYTGNESQRMFLIIEMLERYLKLSSDTLPLAESESFDDDETVTKESSLSPVEYDSSAVNSPDNVSPPSFQNFGASASAEKESTRGKSKQTASSSAPVAKTSQRTPNTPHSSTNPSYPSHPLSRPIGGQHTSLLLENLRSYGRSNRSSLLSSMNFTPAVLKDKQLLRRIRDELKQQQLELILNRHSRRPFSSDGLRTSTSLFALPTLRSFPTQQRTNVQSEQKDSNLLRPSSSQVNDPNASTSGGRVPLISIKYASQEKGQPNTTEGTQTDAIPVNLIYQQYNEYRRRLEQEHAERLQQAKSANVLSKSMSVGNAKLGGSDQSTKHSKRKSSIDNEDVSQSVSDTIKRYLRMARKKPSSDSEANRFKRINYDTNLRNITSKAEIPKPDDLTFEDGTTKCTQTNDDWCEIVIQQIREQMAANDKNLPLSDCTDDYHHKMQGASPIDGRKPTSVSTPTSPTGFFHSSNWTKDSIFGHKKDYTGTSNKNNTFNMQKSKSSTNVGQVFSKKIWKSRSKSQTRPDSPAQPHWTPQGNCIWKSSSGKYLQLKKTHLRELSDVERKSLQRIALDRINQLNIGVSVKLPSETSATDGLQQKSQKRRAPLLLKRKALTTSFFDSNKLKSDGRKGSTSNQGGGLIFGQPLEKCLSNDNAFTSHKFKGSDDSGGVNRKLSRKSRSSITSLDNQSLQIGSNISSDGNYSGSCDSLFSKNDMRFTASNSGDSLSDTGGYGNSLDDDDSNTKFSNGSVRQAQPQVPPLILACIDHLSMYGLNVVGIFRVSTSKRRIRELREELDCGSLKSFDAETSPHDVASLLKEYLRDLPEPLLCRSLYPAFLSTQKIRNRRLQLEALSHLIQLLPIAHRDTLYVLLKFLAHVARCSDDVMNLATNTCISVGNKMDSANLATVIAPNILHSKTDSNSSVATDEQAEERLDVINVVRTMIDHYEELFAVPSDVMDDVYTVMMDSYPQQLDYIFDRKDGYDVNSRKDDQDRDSSASSSKSPGAMQLHTQHFFPQQSSDRTDSNDFVPPTTIAATTATDESDQPRRMYVREQFTHENTVRGNVAEPGENIIRRRERGSRSKNLNPEHDAFSRRRRRERPSSSSNNSSPSDDAVRYNLNLNLSPPTTPTNKSSPDHKSNSNEVLLASLKLPVQMINTTAIHADVLTTAPPLSLTSDLSDIPYIEDVDANNGFRNTTNVTPAYSVQQQQQSTLATSKSLSQTNPLLKKCAFPLTKLKSQYKPTQTPLSTVPIDQTNPSKDSDKQSTKPRMVETTVLYTTEPKLTASITNIGGDVMRSKTAEFERMLIQQNKQQQQQQSVSRSSSQSNQTQQDAARTTMKTKTSDPANVRNGPIYKRRDVISSALNLKK